MALRILLADDSMTSQNMGKKILAEAGYDVVAVSNGAAAIKKLAESRPDFAILDIYMPGYNGLEVCQKIKGAPDTASIPVLLTVGKMEPFRPEDAARVGAEGTIVKPFEATDLLAAVQKIIQGQALATPAGRAPVAKRSPIASRGYEATQRVSDAAEKTLVMAPSFDEDDTYSEWKTAAATPEAGEAEGTMRAVAAEMEVTPAMGDLHHEYSAAMAAAAVFAPQSAEIESAEAEIAEAESAEFASAPAIPGFELMEAPGAAEVAEVSNATEAVDATQAAPENPAFEDTGRYETLAEDYRPEGLTDNREAEAQAAAELAEEPSEEAVGYRTLAEPSWMEAPARGSAAPELEPTAPAYGEVAIVRDPAFEATELVTSAQIEEVATDPNLVTSPTELASFITRFGVEGADDVSVGVASDVPVLHEDEAPPSDGGSTHVLMNVPTEMSVVEGDIPEVAEVVAAPEPEQVSAGAEAAVEVAQEVEEEIPAEIAPENDPLLQEMHAVISGMRPEPVEPEGVAAVVTAAPEEHPAVSAPAASHVPDMELAAAIAAAVGAEAPPPMIPAEAAPDEITAAIGRVFDRWKPELIAEVLKELKRR